MKKEPHGTSTDKELSNKTLYNRLAPPDSLELHIPDLARIFAGASRLPDPTTVKAMGRAVFPTVRASRQHPRFSCGKFNEMTDGMYDDNTTPKWALAWTHGIRGGKQTGWMFAHVWHATGDIHAYTHLANIVLVPECFGGLTDKKGPLTAFLKWHAWSVYKWRPDGSAIPQKPVGYDEIEWKYLDGTSDPKELVRAEFKRRNNHRMRILEPIMKSFGYFD